MDTEIYVRMENIPHDGQVYGGQIYVEYDGQIYDGDQLYMVYGEPIYVVNDGDQIYVVYGDQIYDLYGEQIYDLYGDQIYGTYGDVAYEGDGDPICDLYGEQIYDDLVQAYVRAFGVLSHRVWDQLGGDHTQHEKIQGIGYDHLCIKEGSVQDQIQAQQKDDYYQ